MLSILSLLLLMEMYRQYGNHFPFYFFLLPPALLVVSVLLFFQAYPVALEINENIISVEKKSFIAKTRAAIYPVSECKGITTMISKGKGGGGIVYLLFNDRKIKIMTIPYLYFRHDNFSRICDEICRITKLPLAG